jgi:hypothetical protein
MKEIYERPDLIEFGTVEDLTRTGNVDGGDQQDLASEPV